MKLKLNVSMILVLSLMPWRDVIAQSCLTSLSQSTPTARFTINTDSDSNPDGTVTDGVTGLMWARCSVGQVWESDTSSCSETALTYAWQEALAVAEAYNSVDNGYAEYSDWRLPNIKELRSIVEIACSHSSINETVFPNNESYYYWSNSFYTADTEKAWVIRFNLGMSFSNLKSEKYYVRLVRSGQ